MRCNHHAGVVLIAMAFFASVCSENLNAQTAREELEAFLNNPVMSRGVDEETALRLLRLAIQEKNLPMIRKMLATEHGVLGGRLVATVRSLPESYLHQYLVLLVNDDSFWKNLTLDTDYASELHARHQIQALEGFTNMLQRDVDLYDLYDPIKRKRVQQAVNDVFANGLKNRDPNWVLPPKPLPPGDASTKKAITIKTRVQGDEIPPELIPSDKNSEWRDELFRADGTRKDEAQKPTLPALSWPMVLGGSAMGAGLLWLIIWFLRKRNAG